VTSRGATTFALPFPITLEDAGDAATTFIGSSVN
jgi:hypothetical protein